MMPAEPKKVFFENINIVLNGSSVKTEVFRACLKSGILALQTPKFHLAGSKRAENRDFCGLLTAKIPNIKQALRDILINHCSPVLLGCKPAALFTLRSENAGAVLSTLLRLRLGVTVLRKTENGLLVLAFEKKRLEKTVLNRDILPVLAGIGYPSGASLVGLLAYLRKQFSRTDFPHEIGFFLGYPPDDVIGFVRHSGRNYKFSGYWKVYGDVEHAKKLFRQFDACRECFRASSKFYLAGSQKA
jgi:hypothetical protein